MLRDVKSGQTYTVTDHGEPIATVTPIRSDRLRSGASPRARVRGWAINLMIAATAAAHGAAVLTRNVQDVEGLEGFVPIIQA